MLCGYGQDESILAPAQNRHKQLNPDALAILWTPIAHGESGVIEVDFFAGDMVHEEPGGWIRLAPVFIQGAIAGITVGFCFGCAVFFPEQLPGHAFFVEIMAIMFKVGVEACHACT